MKSTVLITGCSSGIGKQLAQAMHQSGYKVFASARSIQKLSTLAALGIQTLELDVTDEHSVNAAVNRIEAEGHKVDILVNNAGYGAMGPLAEMPSSEFERQFQTNVYGPINLVRACVPQMRNQGHGLIVNIGSVSGILVTPFSGAYCATKAALHALSDALRMELAPFNINVLTIMPGAIESEFGNNAEASLQRTYSDQSMYHWAKTGILKRAKASQSNPTPTTDFVNALIQQIEKPSPPAVATIGNGSTALPLMARVVPRKIRDNLLMRSFGLTKNRKDPQ